MAFERFAPRPTLQHSGAEFKMTPSNIQQWRTHQFVASLAAILIQAVVFIAIVALGMPQDVFASPAFHIGVAVTIGAVVLAVRRLAHEAFRDALASRHARLAGHRQRTVALSAQCPRRALVLLHVQLNRQPFDPAPFDPAAFDPALY